MQPGEIREHLVDRLASVFGAPKNPEGLAAELAKHVVRGALLADIDDLAERVIATRRTKGFPAASELISAVKSIAPVAQGGVAGAAFEGEINFEGEAPVTWVLAEDPRWDELCKVARAADRQCRPFAMLSKHAPGLGRFFRTEQVRALPITDAERLSLVALYERARRVHGDVKINSNGG